MAGRRQPVDLVDAEVVAVRAVSPSLVRMELGGPELAGFEALGPSDEACVLHAPLAAGGHDSRGRWYTLQPPAAGVAAAGGRVAVEMVTHEGGVAASWARRAAPGDRVRLSTRSSWFRRPDDAGWQVLLGDLTALPAIARIVAETPDGVRTVAVVEIADPDDARELSGADVSWVHNPTLVAGSRLAELARGLALPAGPGYVYAAGEAAATRGVRRHLRHERVLPPSRYGVVGYWRLEAERWLRRYERSAEQYEQIWRHAESAGHDDEEIRDIYEAGLAAAGLL